MDDTEVTRPAGTSSAGAAGLTAAEAGRRHPPGGNRLPVEKPPSPIRLLVQQIVHFFALLLWAAAALGQRLPTPIGLAIAAGAVPAVLAADALAKGLALRRRPAAPERVAASTSSP